MKIIITLTTADYDVFFQLRMDDVSKLLNEYQQLISSSSWRLNRVMYQIFSMICEFYCCGKENLMLAASDFSLPHFCRAWDSREEKQIKSVCRLSRWWILRIKMGPVGPTLRVPRTAALYGCTVVSPDKVLSRGSLYPLGIRIRHSSGEFWPHWVVLVWDTQVVALVKYDGSSLSFASLSRAHHVMFRLWAVGVWSRGSSNDLNR